VPSSGADTDPRTALLVLRALPPGARQVLLAGRDDGLFAALRQNLPSCAFTEVEPTDGLRDLPGEPGTLDCIVCGSGFTLRPDPAFLRRVLPLLRPGGYVLWSAVNAQHHSHLAALLHGEQPSPLALTWPAAFRTLLDSGLSPAIADAAPADCPPELLAALAPLLESLGLHPARLQRHLSAAHYIFRGDPLLAETDDVESATPLTIVACVSDEATLRANLLRSPCLGSDLVHELLLYRGCASAAEGLNRGLAAARHPLVVCLHQDVYLPEGWPRRFLAQYRQAEQTLGPLGVAGVYGVKCQDETVVRAGHVVDRECVLREPPPLPCAVDTLDELLLAVPRGTPLRFDPALGFHLYGADLCVQARERHLPVAALDALCFHNSDTFTLPPEFSSAATMLARKWAACLPIATSCVHMDAHGRVRVS
jgi:hypothetical protein